MKINDIIAEGWGTVASNLAKDFVGIDRDKPWINKTNANKQFAQPSIDQAQAQADTRESMPNPKEGSVLLVRAPNGEQYFKSYTGSWHLKGKLPADFSVGGTKITAPKDIAALDQLLPDATLVGVKPDPKNPNGDSWIYDKRNTALLAKRSGNK